MGPDTGISVAQIASIVVLELHGEHDVSTDPDLRSVVVTAARPGTSVVFDLTTATFIDSSVVTTMIYAATNADAVAIVAAAEGHCRRVLEQAGTSTWIALCPSREAAVHEIERVSWRPSADGTGE